jgi:hypothetical protein
MGKARVHILKSNDVKLEGQYHLDATQLQTGMLKEECSVSAPPQVQVVESYPEFAIIEISCSCGTKTRLKCEYAEAKSPDDQKPDQTTK